MEKVKIQRLLLVVIFVSVGVVLLVQFVNMPSANLSKKAVIDQPAESYEDQLMKAEMMVNRMNTHRMEMEEMQKKLDLCVNEIPAESDHTWLSRQINSIARGIGVSELSQKFRKGLPAAQALPPELAGRYAEKAWEIKMRCGYHDLGEFLNRLEESNAFLEIVDITIEGNDPRGQRVSVLIRYLVKREADA